MSRTSTPPTTTLVPRALRAFLDAEVSGGMVLLGATVLALAWANSPWQEAYRDLWGTELVIGLGDQELGLDLRHWVNEGLMAVFFLVVGLEVKREVLEGDLRDPRAAALPVVAALGGMVVPGVLYLALNLGGEGSRGWGIPMATDIAFAVGVVALLGRRVPGPLKLFLLTLAIVDDIGAIVVIALFYSEGIKWEALLVAVALLGVVLGLREAGVTFNPVFVALGVAVWVAFHEAGVHATLAGVAMAFLTPAKPTFSQEIMAEQGDELSDVFSPRAARHTARLARLSVSRMEWLQHSLHPWTSFLVVPVFALANAGLTLSGNALSDAAGSTVTAGVLLGLVVGKPLGISAFAWAACRLQLSTLPQGVRWRQLVGIAAVAGIGFTVSLFIAGLAFESGGMQKEATMGVLASSIIAAGVGTALLLRGTDDAAEPAPE